MADLSENIHHPMTSAEVLRLAKAHLAQVPPSLGDPTIDPGLALDKTHPQDSGAIAQPSDFDLNPGAINEVSGHIGARPAAVLVPIMARSPPTVLFTQRPDHMPEHSGQISFPGGKKDVLDANLTATALREAKEEIGLAASELEIIGYLDAYQTGTGYLIAPMIAMVKETFVAQPNAAEVAEVFEVPLAFLMDARNHKTHSRMINGQSRKFYAMPFEDRYIWGVTAGILKNLHTRLFGE